MFLNKVFVLGNLTAEPNIKALPSGQMVANFGLATNIIFYDKEGQKQQDTEFHNIVAFGKTAEIINQYLKRGSLVLIEGRLRTRSWQDSAGNKRYRTEIITERLQMGPKPATTPSASSTPSDEKPSSNEKSSSDEIPIIEEEEEINIKDIPF